VKRFFFLSLFLLLFVQLAQLGLISDKAYAVCAPRNVHFSELVNFFDRTALVTPENRQLRRPNDLGDDESIQGRVWCVTENESARFKGIPSKSELKAAKARSGNVGNATLHFEDDVVVVNRHLFVEMDGAPKFKPENCFFEHIVSEEIIAGTKYVSYLPYSPHSNGQPDYVGYYSTDVAVWRLSKKPDASVKLIDRTRYVMDEKKEIKTLSVAANYADNFRPRGSRSIQKESLTISSCESIENVYQYGRPTTIVYTNCNTGLGTSGALVYSSEGGTRKPVGIVVSHHNDRGPGTGYVKNEQDTLVMRFDSRLLELYRNLPQNGKQALKAQ
jgi:hypothetical protein